MNDQDKQAADLEGLIRELISMISENSGKLDTMSSLFAKTTLATENAVSHTRTLAENSDWEKRGKAINAILTKAMEKNHTALHASSRAAEEMQHQASQIVRAAEIASKSQTEASGNFYNAANRLIDVVEQSR
jgi:glycogen debranching enzyme